MDACLRFAGFTILVALASHCNNYDLYDNLANPGGKSFVAANRLYAFVGVATTQGDMSGLPGASCPSTGIARADCYCQNTAAAANLLMAPSSRFVAWLTDTVDNMTCRITGASGSSCTPSGSPTWFTTADEKLFEGYSAPSGVLAATPITPLGYTESRQLSPSTFVWTGTSASGGSIAGGNCSSWTNGTSAPSGTTGLTSSISGNWTNDTLNNCNATAPVYCFAIP